MAHLANALKNSQTMAKVTDVEDGKDELDVGVVSNAVGEGEAAGVAFCVLFARSQSSIEDAVGNGRAIRDDVEIPLIRFELGDGHNLLRREYGELDVFAARQKEISISLLRRSPIAVEYEGNCERERTFVSEWNPAQESSSLRK